MSEPSQTRYLPSFFVGEEITHKDGVIGTVVGADRKKVGHYFVQFVDGTLSSQSCSRLYTRNGDLIEDLLRASTLTADEWTNLIDAKANGLGMETYSEGDKYIGEFDNGQRIGKGVYIWASGEKYEGQWKVKRHGKGTFLFADGRKYEGDWIDGKKEGTGIFVWKNGDRYEGEFGEDSQNGKGTFFFSDGRRYEGDWTDGKKEGKGIFFWQNGDRFEGEFKNDSLNGKGIYLFSDGRKYEGDWVGGKKEGRGIFIWQNGDHYEGEFENDNLNGKGIYLFSDGRKYEGDWIGGKKEGRGIFVWQNGDRYEGEFKNDNLNGKGTYLFADGRKYEGAWVGGKKEGKGIFNWPSGDRYVFLAGTYIGEFADGKESGYGVRTYDCSDHIVRYEGDWINGKKQGLGKEFYQDGSRYEGSFDQGEWEGLGTYYDANGKIEEQGLWYSFGLVESIQTHKFQRANNFEVIALDQGSNEWLTWRKKGVGASDAPVIMGENPWKSANYLLQEKLGNKKEWVGNEATRLGAANEPKIRKYLAEKLGIEINPCCIVSTEIQWMQASLDGLSADSTRVFEIKFGKKVYEHVSQFESPPRYHFGQLQHILSITGLEFIDYVCGWESEKIIHLTVNRDDEYIRRLIEAESIFWQKIQNI